MNLEAVFLGSFWPGIVVWTALYVSDYSLTLTCARLYRRGVNERIAFDGSLEITPYFQKDIDSLRIVSPRFIAALVLSWFYLSAAWWWTAQSQLALYQFVLGAMVSTELAIHVRHLRNLFLFRAIVNASGIQGRIHYSRPIMLRMSSVEILGFSILFGVLFMFTSSWFVLGGAVSCFFLALKHRRLANKCLAKTAVPDQMTKANCSETA